MPPVAGAAAGEALTELLGLNISLSENFGDPAGAGDRACTTEMLAMAITEMSARNLVVITPSVGKRSDCSQWLCDEAGNVIETHEHAGDFKEW